MRRSAYKKTGAEAKRLNPPELPIGSDLGPLRAATFLIALVVVGFALFVAHEATQVPSDGTPRTAAERSLIDARKAIEDDPQDIDARLSLARIYIGTGQSESAKLTLEAVEAIEPGNMRLVHLLGLVELEAGRASEAIPYFERAVEIEDELAHDYALVWADLGRARVLVDDLSGAADAYEQALVYAPQAADIIFALAGVYEGLGMTADAVNAYEGVVLFVPDHQGARSALDRLESDDR